MLMVLSGLRVGIMGGVESIASLIRDDVVEFALDGGWMDSDVMAKLHAVRIKHATNPAQDNFIKKRMFDSPFFLIL